ncbi:MAG: GNAT family N-acetyltransferase [Candidatus Thorarchaeota archaeon]|jgi:phosphinothricin acetyltransferase
MKIRVATKKDKLDLSKIHISEPYYVFNPKAKSKKSIPLDKPIFKNIILVARDGKRIIGFVLANFIHYNIFRYGYIEELYVDKDSRRKGVGTSLIKAMMKKLKDLNVGYVLIGTDKNNKKAIELYKGAGFKSCDDLWFYWDPKEKRG